MDDRMTVVQSAITGYEDEIREILREYFTEAGERHGFEVGHGITERPRLAPSTVRAVPVPKSGATESVSGKSAPGQMRTKRVAVRAANELSKRERLVEVHNPGGGMISP